MKTSPMNLSTRISLKAPSLRIFFTPNSILNLTVREVLSIGFVKLSVKSSSLGEKKMVFSVNEKQSVCVVEDKSRLVLPALEAYADEAFDALRAGKVIAVPTDTLYGFACDACSSKAVNRIYEIKGRKQTSPLAICVADVSEIKRFADTDHLPNGLLESLLPGPVTVVLNRGDSSILEKSLNPGLNSVGVRVPDNEFIRAISRGLGSAMALTSANLSGQPSSVKVNDFENLWQHCACVYDGGEIPSGREGSTVVELTRLGKYKILRPGSARVETIEILERYSLVEEALGS